MGLTGLAKEGYFNFQVVSKDTTGAIPDSDPSEDVSIIGDPLSIAGDKAKANSNKEVGFEWSRIPNVSTYSLLTATVASSLGEGLSLICCPASRVYLRMRSRIRIRLPYEHNGFLHVFHQSMINSGVVDKPLISKPKVLHTLVTNWLRSI